MWPTEYETHFWSDRRLLSVCESDWNTWVGPGGCGKSTDAAVLALEYWMEAPMKTAVIICSTSLRMLRKRIWSEVARFHQALPKGIGPVGELVDSDTMIRWKKGDTKNGIFGIAVEEGPVEEILQNLIGIHTHRVWLILDELQAVREAILKATRNMGKNPVFKFLGMGNPESMNDPLGRLSEPIMGWPSIERMVTEHWETFAGPVKGKGRCDFFAGPKSPACVDPDFAQRNPWMINPTQIANDLRAARGNENDALYQSQTIGWWPTKGITSTVLDDAIIEKFNCKKTAVWTHGFKAGAALDPAFGAGGGDKKILQFFKYGECQDENGKMRWVVELGEWMEVPVDSNSKKETIHYQILEFVKKACEVKHVPPAEFGLDSSGEGGGLHAIFCKEWGPVTGVEFGGKASDRQFREGTAKLASEEFDNRMSELNLMVREFAESNGLRGLSTEAATQFCARKTEYSNKKYRVEPKGAHKSLSDGKVQKGFKQRLGYSPDAADAVAIAVELCLQAGAFPSAEGKVAPDFTKQEQETAQEFSEENYLQAANYDDDYASMT